MSAAPMKLCCPICKKRTEDPTVPSEFRPFCSQRCRLVDLDNWLNETYRISEPLEDTHDLN